MTNPKLALSYLETVARAPHLAYDVEADPKGLVNWFENGLSASHLSPKNARNSLPATSDGFSQWVEELANDFKFVVAETDAWQLLWNDGRVSQRQEKIVRALAGIMWRADCKASDVDISKEVNMGRGSVDFKFSQGWSRRALIEVKFIESSHFFTGASRQLPQYLQTEQIECGFYLAVRFTDADFSLERQQRVTDTCDALTAQKNVAIKPIFVDARPSTKKSASKLTERDG